VASRAQSLRTTLRGATPAFDQTQTTLRHATRTLQATSELTRRLAPGVRELRRVAAPLSDLLVKVDRIGPDAEATVGSLRSLNPDLNSLLTRATRLMPTVRSIGQQAVTQLRCIRPYTPDINSLFSNWGDFISFSDDRDRIVRVGMAQIFGGFNGYNQNSAEISKIFPGLVYAFPRPPGLSAGQPWFLPQCGAGPDALDPARDPEARR
jgi:hypothetical protein